MPESLKERQKEPADRVIETLTLQPRHRTRIGVSAVLALAGAACGELSAIKPGSKVACPDGQAACSIQKVDGGYIFVGVDGGPIRGPDGSLIFVNPDSGHIPPVHPDGSNSIHDGGSENGGNRDGGPQDGGFVRDGGPIRDGGGSYDGGPTPVLCASNEECNDNNACTEGERCAPLAAGHNEHGCVPGTPVNTNDGIACTADSCDSLSGVRHAPDNAACVQTDCLIGECQNDEGCVGTPLPNNIACEREDGRTGICRDGVCSEQCQNDGECDDGKSCTLDACAFDNCEHFPTNEICDDRQFCNGVETCNPNAPAVDPLTGCAPGETFPTCDDGVRCTDDQCDETLNGCVHTPNAATHCDDGNMCNGTETCDPARGCQFPDTPTDCSAVSDQCRIGQCVPASGECVADPRPVGTPCSDNNLCTTPDHCQNGFCVSGPALDCSDDNLCTTDACLPASGCANRPINCSHLIGGDPPTQCRTAACNPDSGECEVNNFENDTPCEDGRFCRVNQACLGGFCGGGELRDCGDGIPCTLDGCSETEETCTHTPQNETCVDDVFCDGTETCNTSDGCVDGAVPECPDEACRVGFCDPSADACSTVPVEDGIACENGDVCTVSDTCQDGVCMGGPAPAEIPGDGIDNDCDLWIDESTGVDFRCEVGASVNIAGVDHVCAGRELLQVPGGASFTAFLPAHRTDPDRVMSAQATLQTTVPPGYGSFVSVATRRGTNGDSNAILHCGDMPPPPPGKNQLCYNSPLPAVATEGEIVTFEVTTRP